MKNFTIQFNTTNRHFALELAGTTRNFEIRPGVGPVGPAGPAGAPGPNSVTSATTSDGTCDLELNTLDITNTAGENGIDVFVSGSGAGVYGRAVDSYGVIGYSENSTGIGGSSDYGFGGLFSSGTSNGAYVQSNDATSLYVTNANASYIAEYADNIVSQSAIERVRGWFVWFYNTFTGRLKTADITADRDWTLPDQSGTIAVFDDTGSLTVDGILYANHIHGNLAGSVYAHVRAGETLAKGDPVYVSGSHGTGANLIPIVSKADASNAAKMPAIGIMDADLANNASGHMVITGTIADLNTAAYAVNDTLYVATGGGLTATPPAANSQPVARVDRSNANNGALIVKVNGLASSGGNGASDANKLVRFSSTGTIPVASIGGLGTGVGTALGNTANGTGGFVTADGTATLTNKTLTSPTINSGISGTAVPSVLQNQAGSSRPICVLFEDFPGLTGSGTHPWNDAGTGSTDAFVTGGAGNFMGTCRLVTGTTSGNTRSRSLGIASSNIFIGAIVRYGFAIPDITSVNVAIGFAGGGSVCYLYYQSAANSGQWTLQTNAGVTTFTSATPQAGNYFSGKRYQVEIERISATQTRILLEIADFNLANWSTVYSGTITHASVSGNWGECTPSFNVATQTNAARTLVVDWASLHLPMILR